MKDDIREISDLPYDQGYEDAQIIQRVALSLTNTLPVLTLRLNKSSQERIIEKIEYDSHGIPWKKKQGIINEDIIMVVEEESSENYSNILGIFEKE